VSAFKSKIAISPVAGTDDLWILDEPIVYQSDLLGREIEVPAGFIYDGNSIPSWLKLLPIVSYFIKDKIAYPGSAALHDFGYRYGTLGERDQVDALYREALEVEGATKARREARYRGVRLGGWVSWGRYRKAERVGENVPTP
jgi:hypothetical protein